MHHVPRDKKIADRLKKREGEAVSSMAGSVCDHDFMYYSTWPCRRDDWCRKCGTMRTTHFLDDGTTKEEFMVPKNSKQND